MYKRSIGGLILTSLRKWKRIIAIGILFGLLFSGYKAYKLPPVMSISEELDVKGRTEKDLLSKKEYLENSILGEIDPYHEWRASADLVLQTESLKKEGEGGYLIETSDIGSVEGNSDANEGDERAYVSSAQLSAMTILADYASYISSLDWTTYADTVGKRPEYIGEVVSVSMNKDALPKASITVKYSDREGAENLLEYVVDCINDKKPSVVDEFGEHTLIISNISIREVVDSGLFAWRNTRITEINNLSNTQSVYNTTGIGAQGNQGVTSKKTHIMNIIKYFVVGMACGVLLQTAVYWLYLMFSGIITHESEVLERYQNEKLAIVPSHSEKGRIGRIVESLVNYGCTNSDEKKCYQFAYNKVLQNSSACKRIAVTGDASDGNLDAIVSEMMGLGSENAPKIERLSNLSRDPDSLGLLSNYDGIITVIKLLSSRFRSVDDIVSICEGAEKKIIGSIIIK